MAFGNISQLNMILELTDEYVLREKIFEELKGFLKCVRNSCEFVRNTFCRNLT